MEILCHVLVIQTAILFDGVLNRPGVVTEEGAAHGKGIVIAILNVSNERAVEDPFDGASIIGHLPDVRHDLRDRAVLILDDLFAQLQLDVVAGIQRGKSQCVGICQSVLFRKYPDQVIAHFNAAVQLHPKGISFVIGQLRLIGAASITDRHQLFVDIVDVAGQIHNER